MASWRHHERTRPGPAATQRHGRGLGLTELSRRLTLRFAGDPAPEAAVPLRARLPTPAGPTRPGRAGSGRGMDLAGRDGRRGPELDLGPGPAPGRTASPATPPLPRPAPRRTATAQALRHGGATADCAGCVSWVSRWHGVGCFPAQGAGSRAWRHRGDARLERSQEEGGSGRGWLGGATDEGGGRASW